MEEFLPYSESTGVLKFRWDFPCPRPGLDMVCVLRKENSIQGCLMTGCFNGGSCLFDKKEETFSCLCTPHGSGDKWEGKSFVCS